MGRRIGLGQLEIVALVHQGPEARPRQEGVEAFVAHRPKRRGGRAGAAVAGGAAGALAAIIQRLP